MRLQPFGLIEIFALCRVFRWNWIRFSSFRYFAAHRWASSIKLVWPRKLFSRDKLSAVGFCHTATLFFSTLGLIKSSFAKMAKCLLCFNVAPGQPLLVGTPTFDSHVERLCCSAVAVASSQLLFIFLAYFYWPFLLALFRWSVSFCCRVDCLAGSLPGNWFAFVCGVAGKLHRSLDNWKLYFARLRVKG